MQNSIFFQEGPRIGNQWDEDLILKAHLKRVIPRNILTPIIKDLKRLGNAAVNELADWGSEAEEGEPKLVSFDPWGRRVDTVKVSPAWNRLKDFAADEGLIAIGYERKQGAYSRIYQFAKLYLFSSPSAMYACPLAMSDGAARLLELYGDDILKGRAYSRLIARDPEAAWTSGQWMTERPGGSDVSHTATIALHEGSDIYRLNGSKWFTSATTSEMAITLARIQDGQGQRGGGSRGLSLFYLETRDTQGRLNGIRIDRLKDKLGTRALPTAELMLEGCRARRIGKEGQGVKLISSLFNITRIYNAIIAVSYVRRALALARDYAHRREAFGKKLIDLPLHAATLAHIEVRFRGSFVLAFSLCELLGKVECGEASADESALLRLLTPVAKLFTAKEAVALVSEALECMGGAGYVENTGFPRLLRDVQVLTIWEGTTNVLSLDMLRAFQKEGVFPVFSRSIEQKLKDCQHPELAPYTAKIEEARKVLTTFVLPLPQTNTPLSENMARPVAFGIARVFIASLLLEHAFWDISHSADPLARPALQRWCQEEMNLSLFQFDADMTQILAR